MQAVLAERLLLTLATARGLVLAGRVVDLAGLKDRVGALCATLLDMGPEDARSLLPRLQEILAQMDDLAAALPAPCAQPGKTPSDT